MAEGFIGKRIGLMLFVCWLFKGRGFWKQVAQYDERHVSVLASMLRRHGGHDLVCVHDGNFNPDVPSVLMPPPVKELSDYLPKLWAFSPEFQSMIGHRFASIDLDVVISGDVSAPLASGDFVIWNQARDEPYNTSLFAVEPGFGTEVWERLSPLAIRDARQQAVRWTGDQSWVAHVLGPGMPTFGEETGIMQYRPSHRAKKPDQMIAGFMCGPYEPFSEADASEWVKEAYH